jgi:hypothetical protein
VIPLKGSHIIDAIDCTAGLRLELSDHNLCVPT